MTGIARYGWCRRAGKTHDLAVAVLDRTDGGVDVMLVCKDCLENVNINHRLQNALDVLIEQSMHKTGRRGLDTGR